MYRFGSIQILRCNGRIALRAPAHPLLSKKARQLGGVYDRRNHLWMFDPAVEAELLHTLPHLYGEITLSPADRRLELERERLRLVIRVAEIDEELGDL